MNFKDFQKKRILVMGLGLHGGGLGVANFFTKIGALVTITDLKTKEDLNPSIKKLVGYPKLVLGEHKLPDFLETDLIIRNPGVPQESKFLSAARKAGVPIKMESSLFFTLSPSKNIIGVTGTKGKTTTTLLIGEILRKAGVNVEVAGNLRISMLDLLQKIERNTWIVLELSSWQLEGLGESYISPHIAVLTNIYQDHLDRYKNFDEYIEAKKNIFKFQKPSDFLVINKLQAKITRGAESKVKFFSTKKIPKNILESSTLIGYHNLENIACATETVKLLGVKNSIIAEALKTFKVNDRLELVRVVSGIEFVNDTTATDPDATIAAISSFSNPIILVVGGADKNLDFSQMAKAINKKVKKVVLLVGSATDKISRLLEKDLVLGEFSSLNKAVNTAFKFANKGDVILLSPGCASFGMFKHEFDRGEQFKKIVEKL